MWLMHAQEAVELKRAMLQGAAGAKADPADECSTTSLAPAAVAAVQDVAAAWPATAASRAPAAAVPAMARHAHGHLLLHERRALHRVHARDCQLALLECCRDADHEEWLCQSRCLPADWTLPLKVSVQEWDSAKNSEASGDVYTGRLAAGESNSVPEGRGRSNGNYAP